MHMLRMLSGAIPSTWALAFFSFLAFLSARWCTNLLRAVFCSTWIKLLDVIKALTHEKRQKHLYKLPNNVVQKSYLLVTVNTALSLRKQ